MEYLHVVNLDQIAKYKMSSILKIFSLVQRIVSTLSHGIVVVFLILCYCISFQLISVPPWWRIYWLVVFESSSLYTATASVYQRIRLQYLYHFMTPIRKMEILYCIFHVFNGCLAARVVSIPVAMDQVGIIVCATLNHPPIRYMLLRQTYEYETHESIVVVKMHLNLSPVKCWI